eukprot:g18951.t1
MLSPVNLAVYLLVCIPLNMLAVYQTWFTSPSSPWVQARSKSPDFHLDDMTRVGRVCIPLFCFFLLLYIFKLVYPKIKYFEHTNQLSGCIMLLLAVLVMWIQVKWYIHLHKIKSRSIKVLLRMTVVLFGTAWLLSKVSLNIMQSYFKFSPWACAASVANITGFATCIGGICVTLVGTREELAKVLKLRAREDFLLLKKRLSYLLVAFVAALTCQLALEVPSIMKSGICAPGSHVPLKAKGIIAWYKNLVWAALLIRIFWIEDPSFPFTRCFPIFLRRLICCLPARETKAESEPSTEEEEALRRALVPWYRRGLCSAFLCCACSSKKPTPATTPLNSRVGQARLWLTGKNTPTPVSISESDRKAHAVSKNSVAHSMFARAQEGEKPEGEPNSSMSHSLVEGVVVLPAAAACPFGFPQSVPASSGPVLAHSAPAVSHSPSTSPKLPPAPLPIAEFATLTVPIRPETSPVMLHSGGHS